MIAFRSLSIAVFKGLVRDKVALFFTFFFPLMFLVVFGLIFKGSTTSKLSIGLVGDGPVITALKQTGAFKIQHFADLNKALKKVKDGDLPAVVAQQDAKIILRFAASDRTAAATVQGIVNGVVGQVNLGATKQPPVFALDQRQIEDSSLKPIQFLAPGVLSWGVALSAVFGASLTLVNWRKKRVLRRIRSSPVSVYTVLSSRLVVAMGVAIFQGFLFIGVAMLPFFGLKLSGRWWLAFPVLLLGTFAFFAVGILVGSFCKSEEAASGVANAVVLPMSFLSGVFFPLALMPSWLQNASKFLPLRHMNDGMTDFLVRGKGPQALIQPCAVLIGFTIVIGFLAAKVFKWEGD